MKFCKNVVLGGYIKCDVFRWFGDIKWGKYMVELEMENWAGIWYLTLVLQAGKPPGTSRSNVPILLGTLGQVMSPPTSRSCLLPVAPILGPCQWPVTSTDSMSQLYYVWGWEAPGWVVRSKFSYGWPPALGLILSVKVKRNGFPLIFYV